MGQPTDEEDDFEVSGPKHLRSRSRFGRGWKIVIDWNNLEHRRCVAACLVKGTAVMERDRIKCRTDNEALAPAWWESLGFIRHKVFKTESIINDHFTYGAIFQPKEPSRCGYAPKYVVAFRGTMLFHPKVLQDLMQDALVMFNALADNRRFKRTHVDVEELIGSNPTGSVWLAGHSLGASLALEIGRNIMLEKGLSVPTFLFNPPHVSPSPVINKVLTEEHKTGLYTGSYAVKFVLANVVPGHRKRTKRLFRQLVGAGAVRQSRRRHLPGVYRLLRAEGAGVFLVMTAPIVAISTRSSSLEAASLPYPSLLVALKSEQSDKETPQISCIYRFPLLERSPIDHHLLILVEENEPASVVPGDEYVVGEG